jgi:3,4-dihydroxy 2-butanone 4-phosphate synthase/GTP cyclohydrolase II
MSQLLSTSRRLEDAMRAVRSGMPVLIRDSADREDETDLAFAASFSNAKLVNFCLTHGRGLLCVSMYPTVAHRLGISRLRSNGVDPLDTPFGIPISLAGRDTGISASARAGTIAAVADSASTQSTFCMPGHVSTLIAKEDGLVGRRGHTEAVLALMRLAQLPEVGAICEVLAADGEVATIEQTHALAREFALPLVTIDDLVSVCVGP